MKKLMMTIVACASLSGGAVFASDDAVCGQGSDATAMRARIAGLEQQVDRLERTSDAQERRSLAELNMKRLREASGQLRRRDLSPECRVELMGAMLQALVRNEQAAQTDSPY